MRSADGMTKWLTAMANVILPLALGGRHRAVVSVLHGWADTIGTISSWFSGEECITTPRDAAPDTSFQGHGHGMSERSLKEGERKSSP